MKTDATGCIRVHGVSALQMLQRSHGVINDAWGIHDQRSQKAVRLGDVQRQDARRWVVPKPANGERALSDARWYELMRYCFPTV
jgi:hypothetical protein